MKKKKLLYIAIGLFIACMGLMGYPEIAEYLELKAFEKRQAEILTFRAGNPAAKVKILISVMPETCAAEAMLEAAKEIALRYPDKVYVAIQEGTCNRIYVNNKFYFNVRVGEEVRTVQLDGMMFGEPHGRGYKSDFAKQCLWYVVAEELEKAYGLKIPKEIKLEAPQVTSAAEHAAAYERKAVHEEHEYHDHKEEMGKPGITIGNPAAKIKMVVKMVPNSCYASEIVEAAIELAHLYKPKIYMTTEEGTCNRIYINGRYKFNIKIAGKTKQVQLDGNLFGGEKSEEGKRYLKSIIDAELKNLGA